MNRGFEADFRFSGLIVIGVNLSLRKVGLLCYLR